MKTLLSKSSFKKYFAMTMSFCLVVLGCCPMLFAADAPVSASDLVGTILGFIVKIFFYIGVILLLWAIGQLVLAFKNDDADSKSKAAMLLVVSIILMVIRPVFNSLGLGVTAKDVTI